MKQLSNRVLAVQESVTLAIGTQAKALKAAGKHIIDFSLGEPDFHTPQHVKYAATKALAENFTYYTAAGGIPELKNAITVKFKRDNNLTYAPEHILVSNGAKHSIMNVFLGVLNPGDEVLIPTPYWTSYPEMVKIAGGIPIICSTDSSFHAIAALLEKKITPKTKLLLLNSPSNPTGAVISKKELQKIAALCVAHDLFVLSDEVYEFFCYDKHQHISIASFGKEIFDRTIIVNAVSKTYSMTGWRIGYLAAAKEMVSKLASLQSQMTSCPNSIAQKAAVAALIGNQKQVAVMRQAFAERREYIAKRLNAVSGLSCPAPEGAFYAFVKFSYPTSSSDFCLQLLNEGLVATVPGSAFGAEGYFRISYATSMDVIKKGCDRIEMFCSKHFLKNSIKPHNQGKHI